jgi:membrane protease YdiL (CAAX protease family)
MDAEIKKYLLRVLPFLLIMLGIAIAIKRKKLNKNELYIQPPNSYKRFLLCWVLFIAFIFIYEVIMYKMGLLHINPWKTAFAPSIIKLIGMVILAPIAEELFFRGVVLCKLRQWKVKKHLAIILQAIFFVALHSLAFENTLSSYLANAQRFTDAIIYAYAMYYTKSLYTPIAMHATGNAVAALEQFIL